MRLEFFSRRRNPDWMPRRTPQTPKSKPGKRKYIGNDIWVTELPDGGRQWDIAFSEDEHANLQTEADETGLTVEQVIKWRLLGDSFLTNEFTTKIKALIADLRSNQALLRKIGSEAPDELTAPLLSWIAAQTRNMASVLDSAGTFEQHSGSQDMRASIAALRTEIDKTLKAILEIA
jgi:hypothetical protein